MTTESPPNRWRRRWPAVAVAVFVLVVAAYAVYWHVFEDRAVAEIEGWIAERRAEGYEISHAPLQSGGFPGRIRVVLDAPRLTAPPASGAWSWQGESLELGASPLDPTEITAQLFGEQVVDVVVDDRTWRSVATASELSARVGFGRRLHSVDVRIRDLGVRLPNGSASTAAALTLTGRHLDSEGAVTFEGVAVRLPGGQIRYRLGRDVERMALAVASVGTLDDPASPAAWLRWRDAGGFLRIDRLDVEYGPLTVDSEGRAALDADGQPEATLTASIVGAEAIIDSLSESGALAPEAVVAARLLLAAMSRRPAGGGAPVLEAPVTLRHGVLAVGPAPILALPPIRWPDDPRT